MEICSDGSRSTFLALGTLPVLGLVLCLVPHRGSIYRSICVRVLRARRSVRIECSRHWRNHSELASSALGGTEQYPDGVGTHDSVFIQVGIAMPPDERIKPSPFRRQTRSDRGIGSPYPLSTSRTPAHSEAQRARLYSGATAKKRRADGIPTDIRGVQPPLQARTESNCSPFFTTSCALA